MKLTELFENVEDWNQNPTTKMFDLYNYFVNITDVNLKFEIADEILEEIDSAMGEFPLNSRVRLYLENIKTTMEAHKHG